MATVTTPTGERLEGVTGTLLDYYRGEGYQIDEDEPVTAETAPGAADSDPGAVDLGQVDTADSLGNEADDADVPHYDA